VSREEFCQKVTDFIQYLQVERNFSHHTVRAYRADLKLFTLFWEQLSPQEESALTLRQVIERYLVSLYYKKIDKSSIARKLSCFQSLAKYLRAQGIKLNLDLKRPRLDKKLPIFLSIDEIRHLLDGVPDDQLPTPYPIRNKTIFELLYATGIRCSELVKIRLCDIDTTNRTIRIRGKGQKERMVLFGKKALKRLNAYLEIERPQPRSAEEPLFLNRKQKGLTSRSIQRVLEMFRPFLKVNRPITPHKLRHSFATHLLNQGADLRVVQELLGHRSLSSTEKYTHVSLEKLTEMCNTIHPINAMLRKRK